MDMDTEPFDLAQADAYPTVTQISVFLVERVGELLRLTRTLDPSDVRIVGLSIVNAVDTAIARMIVDDPDGAAQTLRDAGFAISESELLVVSLPHGKRALLETWSALLSGEVSVSYTYSLLTQPKGRPALAVMADNIPMAAANLSRRNFTLLDQSDLAGGY